MIDLLYSYRRRQFTPKDIQSHIQEYCTAIDAEVSGTYFAELYSLIDFESDWQSIISVIRSNMKFRQSKLTIKRDNVVVKTGQSMGEVARYLELNRTIGHTGTDKRALEFIFMHLRWYYNSLDEIVDCIINNGACSEIELVGPRTKQYFDTIKVKTSSSRFGAGGNHLMKPLFLVNEDVNLSGPPMTIRTWGTAVVERVYDLLGMQVAYFKLPDTKFARPTQKGGHSTVLLDSIRSKISSARSVDDIVCSFLYDYTLAVYFKYLAGITVELETANYDVANLMIGETNQLLRGVSNRGDNHGINWLVTICY